MLRDSFQVEENEDYAMGVPLKSINLGVEQPKPGDVAITAAHRAKWGIFHNVWDALLICKFTLTFIFLAVTILMILSFSCAFKMCVFSEIDNCLHEIDLAAPISPLPGLGADRV